MSTDESSSRSEIFNKFARNQAMIGLQLNYENESSSTNRLSLTSSSPYTIIDLR